MNPTSKSLHDPECRWLNGAATGRDPIDLDTYVELSDDGPFPEGAHGVT